MRNARLDKSQARIKIARRNMNNLRYADDIILMAESEEELRSLLMRVKEGKSWLKFQHSKSYHGIWSHHFMANRWEKMETVADFIFLGSKSLQMVIEDMKLKKSYDKPRQHIKKQRHHFADKGLNSQSYDFSTSHVQMWNLDHKEDREPKNWCFQIVALEKTLESPLDCTEIKPVNPKGNQP